MSGEKPESFEDAVQHFCKTVGDIIKVHPWLISICKVAMELPAILESAMKKNLFHDRRLVSIALRRVLILRRKKG